MELGVPSRPATGHTPTRWPGCSAPGEARPELTARSRSGRRSRGRCTTRSAAPPQAHGSLTARRIAKGHPAPIFGRRLRPARRTAHDRGRGLHAHHQLDAVVTTSRISNPDAPNQRRTTFDHRGLPSLGPFDSHEIRRGPHLSGGCSPGGSSQLRREGPIKRDSLACGDSGRLGSGRRQLNVSYVSYEGTPRLRTLGRHRGISTGAARVRHLRYDLNLWIGHPLEGATYLPR